MGNSIIPEILKRELNPNLDRKQSVQNLNLTQNIDQRTNNNYNNSHNNITNNTYNQKGGFFRFLFDLITLPFKILYKLFMFLEKKFDIKQTLKLEKESLARKKWVKKYFLSTNNSYDFEEIL